MLFRSEVLSDPVVNKCRDPQAIQQFLAQVAYETGYYSTVYQPLDGGAGLIHMIPGNWVPNAGHGCPLARERLRWEGR